MYLVTGLMLLVFVFVEATPEVQHLIQTDSHGQTVQMDVIYDLEDKTVMAIIGDVSKYENGIHTVNLHDYTKGYGALKNINDRVCMLTKSPVPIGTAEKYRVGVTNEVHEHFLKFRAGKLSYADVEEIAGSKIATFCKDYITIYADVTPMGNEKRDTEDAIMSKEAWCLFSACFFNPADLDAATGLLG